MTRIDGAETTIGALLVEIPKLRQAEHVARAAQACADAGSTPNQYTNLNQNVYKIGRLHDATTAHAAG